MKLIDDWKSAWRYYTTWAWAVVLAFPDLYSMVAGLMTVAELPNEAAWGIRGLAVVGFFARLVKQKKPPVELPD